MNIKIWRFIDLLFVVQKNKISITAKAGFPSYSISNHQLKIVDVGNVVATHPIQTLHPGETTEITAKKITSTYKLIIENKDGIIVYNSSL